MRMRRRRVIGATIGTIAMTAALSVVSGPAEADPIAQSGSVSVVVPGTPEDMQFVLTVNGQDYDNATVDNTIGGTLTLAWEGSQEEPTTNIKDCPGKRPGRRISLQGATPSTHVWATWASPSDQITGGIVPVESEETVASVSLCARNNNGNGNGR